MDKNKSRKIKVIGIFLIGFLIFFGTLTYNAIAYVRYPVKTTLNTGDITTAHILNSTILAEDISQTSNFGVGTTTPFALFGISANATKFNKFLLEVASSTQTATTTLLAITNAGQLTMGSTSPIGKITIDMTNSTTTHGLVVKNGLNSGKDLLRLEDYLGNSFFNVNTFGNAAFGKGLAVNNVYGSPPHAGLIVLSPSGTQVGISIKNGASQTGNMFQHLDNSNNILSVINSSGYYGIGTATPYSLLTVNGNLNIENTNSLLFYELSTNGRNTAGLKATSSMSASVTWSLPAIDGSAAQSLLTNGNGSLYFGGNIISNHYIASTTRTADMTQTVSYDVDVNCPGNQKVLGGGGQFAGNFSDHTGWAGSYPLDENTWRMTYYCGTAGNCSENITAWAVCVD